ncbi:Structural maintenance of chromosome protein 2 [Trachipleistophora hominis]|uniref:Structural maintenance of chromosome protein 2 n=1 Tax=Trachipleistophora hominis TaxID=72359 RepID=L7JWV8_TRAHO|nr:Structural maintenance of chromosome protein 2 [Trachipleistophora hominis]
MHESCFTAQFIPVNNPSLIFQSFLLPPMELKQLTITNFKSISKTTLNICTFTAITGLNGSGKSNILDAIMFCLDKGNMRMMRVECYKDLIRAGEQSCTVEMVFTSLVIRREVTREGKSKVYVNNHPASLSTVRTVTAAFNILLIQQGTITKFLHTNDLQSFINYCVGTVNHYKQRLSTVMDKENKLNGVKKQLSDRIAPFFSRLRAERENTISNRKRMGRKKVVEERLAYARRIERLLELVEMQCINEHKKNIKQKLERINRSAQRRQHCKEEKVKMMEMKDEMNALQEREKRAVPVVQPAKTRGKEIEEMISIMEGGMDVVGVDEERLALQEDVMRIERELEGHVLERRSGKSANGNDGSTGICGKNEDSVLNYKNTLLEMSNDVKSVGDNVKKLKELSEKIKFVKNEAWVSRTEGRVFELFTLIDSKYKRAVDTILGNKRNYYVVKSSDLVKDIIKDGNGTFIPLDKIKYSDNKYKGNLLIQKIKYREEHRNAFYFLFNNYYVFDNDKDARSFSFDKKVITVTLEGTVYDYRGVISGGMVNVKDMVGKGEIEKVNRENMDVIREMARLIDENVGRGVENDHGSKGGLDDRNRRGGMSGTAREKVIGNFNGVHGECIADSLIKRLNTGASINTTLSNHYNSCNTFIDTSNKKMEKIRVLVQKGTRLNAINKIIEGKDVNRISELRAELVEERRKEEETKIKEKERDKIIEENDKIEQHNEGVRRRKKEIEEYLKGCRVDEEEEVVDSYEIRYNLKNTLVKLEGRKIEENAGEQIEEIMKEGLEGVEKCLMDKEDVLNNAPARDAQVTTMDTIFGTFLKSGSHNFLDLISALNSYLSVNDCLSFIHGAINKYEQEIKDLAVTKKEMDPKNFDLLEKNEEQLTEIKNKIAKLEIDKKKIMKSINEFEIQSEAKRKTFIDNINNTINDIISVFIPECNINIHNDALNITINNNAVSINELSGGQRSLIAVAMMFSCMDARNCLCLFDEIDSALDLGQTQRVSMYLRDKGCQVVVVSLKEGFYSCADVIYQVYKENNYGKVQRVR